MAPPANLVLQHETNPDEKTIEAAARLYVELFKDGMHTSVFILRESIRAHRRISMTTGVLKPLSLISGELYTAKDENGELVGFTAWAPPGRATFDTPDQLEMGYIDFVKQLDEDSRKFQSHLFREVLPKFVDESLEMENPKLTSGDRDWGCQGEKKTYWCWYAMVRPDYQGKGIARALFSMVYEKAKATGATMALITNSRENIAKYGKLGFKELGEIDVKSPWGEWPYYCMARETKAS
ncbi:hypothetical protein ONZ51_g733 [Trametes cubensis]|uniref:N-acetyltransferase domain-containing protein n=1 Tax=Trametes cubensis TaxID=1111947 RepID=A0AAD7U459_9APHY|nr:hypothetical protein ONZ51_g733 [Trametes cubensis]